MTTTQRIAAAKPSRENAPKTSQSSTGFFKVYFNLLEEVRRCSNGNYKSENVDLQRMQKPKVEKQQVCQSKKEFEALYLEVLYTINHKVGRIVVGIDKMVEYAREAFGVPAADHARLMAKAKDEMPPIVTLHVTIISCRDLEAKDANGFSDPYCMLGIVPARTSVELETSPNVSPQHKANQNLSAKKSPVTLRRGSLRPENEQELLPRVDSHSSRLNPSGSVKYERDKSPARKLGDGIRKKLQGDSKNKEKDSKKAAEGSPNVSPGGSLVNVKDSHELIPAKYIRSTTVKPKTLNPVWNESFRLDVDDPAADVLHIDIWDHDDESNVFDAVSRLNEVKGMKGLYRYFKQIGQSARSEGNEGDVDDFLGSFDMKISEIPSTGFDKWIKLQPRSNQMKLQGELHLKLALGTREDRGISEEEDNALTFSQHHEMVFIFAEFELRRKSAQEIADWHGDLQESAETILHQHALQGALTDLQKAVCRWIAYSKLSRTYNVSAHVLQRTLHKMESINKPDTLKSDERDILRDSFEALIEESMLKIQQPEVAFPLRLSTVDSVALSTPLTPTRKNQPRKDKDEKSKGIQEANEEQLRNLGYLLQTLAYLYQMELYRFCCPFGKEIQSEILNALRKRFGNWQQKLKDREINANASSNSSCSVSNSTSGYNSSNSNGDLSSPTEQNNQTDASTCTANKDLLLSSVVSLEEAVLELSTVLRYNEVFQREIAFPYYGSFHKLVVREVRNRMSSEVQSNLVKIVSKIGTTAHINEQLTQNSSSSASTPTPATSPAPSSASSSASIRDLCVLETMPTFLQVMKMYLLIKETIARSKQLHHEVEVTEKGVEDANHLQTVVIPWFDCAMKLWINDLKQSIQSHIPLVVDIFFKNPLSNVSLMQNCLIEICQFSASLFSYETAETLNYIWALCELLAEAASKYCSMMQERLRLQGFGDEEGQFDASEHLCIVLNSVELVRVIIRALPESLYIQKLQPAVAAHLANETQAAQALAELTKFNNEASSKVEFDLRCLIYRCSAKMRPEIRKYVCHLSWVPEHVSPEECSRELFDYVTNNTVTVLKHSLDKNSARFILAIWNQVLEQVEEQVDKVAADTCGPIATDSSPTAAPSSAPTSAEKKETESFASSAFSFVQTALTAKLGSVFGSNTPAGNSPSTPGPTSTDSSNDLTGLEVPPAQLILVCTRLLYAIRIILANFEKAVESVGLKAEALKTDLHKRVTQLLRWNQVPTLTVIEQYMSELLELQQAANESKFGYLTVRCVYRNDRRCLVIEVLSAKGLTPLDSNGLSDPFVCIELYPPHAFPSATKKQTKVIPKCLDPTFDESFEISADLTACRRIGSAILFTVMDYDMIFQNDFGGEAVLALKDIPGVFSDDVKGFNSLKSITLPILHVKHDSGAIGVLQRRKDRYAREFAKRRMQVAMQELKPSN